MRDPSPYAGQTVRLRADAAELGGHRADVVDWYERLGDKVSWRDNPGDPRAQGYSVRRGLGGLVDDDEVLFARVDGMGQLIHLTEIEGATGSVQTPTGPAMVNLAEVGNPCLACGEDLAEGDMVAAIRFGPGKDPKARAACRAGQPYEAVMADIHWACHTGDESYGTGREA